MGKNFVQKVERKKKGKERERARNWLLLKNGERGEAQGETALLARNYCTADPAV